MFSARLRSDMVGSLWDRAITEDTGLLLAALVVAGRPWRIVECGTYPGRSTRALAGGVRLAGRGRIDTYERDPLYAGRMVEEFADTPQVTVHEGRPTSFAAADLAVIDSGPTYADRDIDLACWTMTAVPGSLLVVDDINEPWFERWTDRLGPGVTFAGGHGVGVWLR